MYSTTFTKYDVLKLKDYGFRSDLENEIYSYSLKMNSSPSETVEMILRNHFSLPVPEKWKPNTDSWITSAVDYVY